VGLVGAATGDGSGGGGGSGGTSAVSSHMAGSMAAQETPTIGDDGKDSEDVAPLSSADRDAGSVMDRLLRVEGIARGRGG